ncbi:TnsA endonuclease N-terminal domain-containing protein [Aquitalea pelogenes]|uniref:TnsA endonuclease N-terminal domain-containing protein n=1 Tax=Aquitalea pelogenes TaxID=1293573 RepID=UPI0035AF39F5
MDRVYHLLSDLEFAYFLTLEFSERVIDIREQYPILPVREAQDIAASLGIKYPNYPGTKVPFVLTTDFLVTYLGEDGQPHLAARTVKYEEDLLPSPKLEWTLQKLEIERCFWMNRRDDWLVVTDLCIGPAISHNLQWLRKGVHLERRLQDHDLHCYFLDIIGQFNGTGRTLSSMIRAASKIIHLTYNDGVVLFKHLVWNKSIRFDLQATPLQLTMEAPVFELFSETASPVFTSKVA